MKNRKNRFELGTKVRIIVNDAMHETESRFYDMIGEIVCLDEEEANDPTMDEEALISVQFKESDLSFLFDKNLGIKDNDYENTYLFYVSEIEICNEDVNVSDILDNLNIINQDDGLHIYKSEDIRLLKKKTNERM